MNANGMIDSAADYDFVDFANGDLPTGNFDGNIMPLRDANAAQDILKAEDIAFLVESTRDKAGALSSITFPSLGLGPYSQDIPDQVELTKKISSSQMLNIRSYLEKQLDRGLRYGLHGFLSASLVEASPMLTWENNFASKIETIMSSLDTTYGGHWNVTSAAANFAVGAKVARAPVRSLFEDIKNLEIPAWWNRFGGSFLGQNDMEAVYSAGSGVYDPGNLGHHLNWNGPADTNYVIDVYANRTAAPTMASVPDTYLSDAHLWLVYQATNIYIINSDTPAKFLCAAGIIDMEVNAGSRSGFVYKVHNNGAFTWRVLPWQTLNLTQKIASDCGWTLYDQTTAIYQGLTPTFDCALLIVGTPNGRTRWW